MRSRRSEMEIVHAAGLEGAAAARGLVVVIDVLRAFSVSAWALASGARESILVRTVDEALRLQARMPDSVVSAEVGGRPIPGIPISNSPSQVRELELGGRTLIQRTSAGTQGAAAAAQGRNQVLAGSLVVAGATARHIRELAPLRVTFVAMGEGSGHPEDRACALYMEACLRGQEPDRDRLLAPLLRSTRYRRLARGQEPGFPAGDLALCLDWNRFDFVQPVLREGTLLKLRRQDSRQPPDPLGP